MIPENGNHNILGLPPAFSLTFCRGDHRSPAIAPPVGAITDRPYDGFIFIRNGDFLDRPKRKKNRLQDYDYSTPNVYFLTICTRNRVNLFWTTDVTNVDSPRSVPLNAYGKIVRKYIEHISAVYSMVVVDQYVIMPNHVHLLLQINDCDNGRSMIAPTISNVVRHLKGCVSKELGFSVWQKGFYDHVIRNEVDYENIWIYIEGNPGKRFEDELYVPM